MRPETQYFKTTQHSTLLYPVLLISLILPFLHFFHLMTYYTLCVCVCSVAQLCLTLCDSMNQPRHRTQVSCIAGGFFTIWATREAFLPLNLPAINCLSLSFLRLKIFSFFSSHYVACGILVPRPGIKPVPPAVEAESPNHWTTREVCWLCLSQSTFCERLSPFRFLWLVPSLVSLSLQIPDYCTTALISTPV